MKPRAQNGEEILKVVFGGVEGKISYKQFGAHSEVGFERILFAKLFPNVGFQILTEAGSLEDSPCLAGRIFIWTGAGLKYGLEIARLF